MKASRSYALIALELIKNSDFIANIVNQVDTSTFGVFPLDFTGTTLDLTEEQTKAIINKYPKISHNEVILSK